MHLLYDLPSQFLFYVTVSTTTKPFQHNFGYSSVSCLKLKEFLSNSQFKSKQNQKLERWLVSLEFTRANNKKKWRSQVIILKVLENPEGLLARLKPQIHLILSPCLEPSSHSLSNLWPHRLLLLFYCWQKIKEWDRRSREKRGKELWDMCIIVWYIYLCSSFGGKMGSSFTRAQPFRLWAGHLRRVRCSFLSSKSRLGLLLLLPSCSNDSHFSSTFISFPLWLGWW